MAGKLQNLELSLKRAKELNLPISFILVHDGLDEATDKEVSDLAVLYKAKYLNLAVNSPGLARNYGYNTQTLNGLLFGIATTSVWLKKQLLLYTTLL